MRTNNHSLFLTKQFIFQNQPDSAQFPSCLHHPKFNISKVTELVGEHAASNVDVAAKLQILVDASLTSWHLHLNLHLNNESKCEMWSQSLLFLNYGAEKTPWGHNDLWPLECKISALHHFILLNICVKFDIVCTWVLSYGRRRCFVRS